MKIDSDLNVKISGIGSTIKLKLYVQNKSDHENITVEVFQKAKKLEILVLKKNNRIKGYIELMLPNLDKLKVNSLDDVILQKIYAKNLIIKSINGDVNVSINNSDYIDVETENGDIFVNLPAKKFCVNIKTENGEILQNYTKSDKNSKNVLK